VNGARALKAKDPNAQATNIVEFHIDACPMRPVRRLFFRRSKARRYVIDFWPHGAPVRTQQPLIEKVKKHFCGQCQLVSSRSDTDDDNPWSSRSSRNRAGTIAATSMQVWARHLAINSFPEGPECSTPRVTFQPDHRSDSRSVSRKC